MLKRSPTQFGTYEAAVSEIIAAVREKKDEAVFAYTEKFDGAKLDASTVEVTEQEIGEAYAQVDSGLIQVIRKARENILAYHEKQKENSWFTSTEEGTLLGQKVTPLNRVGVYVPGGKAAYPSSVLMNVLPAQVAGVREICMTTPCSREGKVNPVVLAAAKEAGVQRIVQGGRGPGDRGAGLRHREHSEGGQDRRTGKHLCGAGKESGVRQCQHRFHRRSSEILFLLTRRRIRGLWRRIF